MRLGPIIGSIVVHAWLVAAIAPIVRTVPPVAPPPESDPVEVEVIEESDARTPDGRAPDGRAPDGRAPDVDVRPSANAVRLAATESRTSGIAGHEPDAAGHEPDTAGTQPGAAGHPPDAGRGPGRPGSLYMHMRGPELHLSEGELDRILDNPLGPPPEVHRSGRLHPAGGGESIIPDAATIATVERDGTAHFHDKPDIDIHFHLPTHPPITERELRATKEELGKALRDWYADPEKIARGGHATDLPEHLKAEPQQCDAWGNKMCEPEPMPPPQTVVSGKFDLTSYLMRKLGVGDPFAARKRAMLESTFDERADIGGRYRGEQLERSVELVRKNLSSLWAATADPAVRREVLFELWDECAEGEGPLGEAGQRARAEVIGWIGAHLPRGSAGAYSDEELAALGKRRSSKQPFEPYRAVVESGDVGSAGFAR
jgi:hypothetical protein